MSSGGKSIHAIVFQSTHSRGVRRDVRRFDALISKISIHALARSATKKNGLDIDSQNNFNPRTREECDLKGKEINMKVKNFNPRTREECDLMDFNNSSIPFKISIHALARSATGPFSGTNIAED